MFDWKIKNKRRSTLKIDLNWCLHQVRSEGNLGRVQRRHFWSRQIWDQGTGNWWQNMQSLLQRRHSARLINAHKEILDNNMFEVENKEQNKIDI